jgi:hypothetical protein
VVGNLFGDKEFEKRFETRRKLMKNRFLIMTIALLIIVLALSACGGNAGEATNAEQNNGASAVENPSDDASSQTGSRPVNGEGFQGELPLSARLGFGTLMLEGTEYAVDPAQAAQLLPLWKAAKSLSDSETTAEAELEAVFNQIQDTMTSEQLSAIADMQFTGEEMAQRMEDLGISFGFGGSGFGNLTPEQQATAQAARESGEGFPGGGFFRDEFPGGGNLGGQGPGGQGFGGGNLTPEQQATLEARRAERGNVGARFALVFVDPLIELLEERAAE